MTDPMPCGLSKPVAMARNRNMNKIIDNEIRKVSALAVFSECSCDSCLTRWNRAEPKLKIIRIKAITTML